LKEEQKNVVSKIEKDTIEKQLKKEQKSIKN
jgi:hypothetical protein